MRVLSSAVSITVHVAVGAALLLGTAKTGRSGVPASREVRIVLPLVRNENHDYAIRGPSIPGPVAVPTPDFGKIALPSVPQPGATTQPASDTLSVSAYTSGASQTGWRALLSEQPAEILTAPLPAYPELLRQAGVQGRVVLEAVVDTTGRVLAASILVISGTNPAFVTAARQALLATLFRPAMVGGKAVQMRIRIPYDFTIRNGMGRAR